MSETLRDGVYISEATGGVYIQLASKPRRGVVSLDLVRGKANFSPVSIEHPPDLTLEELREALILYQEGRTSYD